MKKPKIVILDGMATSGKTTISYLLAKKLSGWILVDIWRIKDMFVPIGYGKNLNKEESKIFHDLSKKEIFRIAKEIIRKTQRNIIIHDIPVKDVKKKLGKDLKYNNYQVFSFQLKVSFEEAMKINRKREKPDLDFSIWTKERWDNKIQRKIKKGDIVVDTSENNQEKVVNIILKAIGEKSKKHPYEKSVRKFW